MFPGQETPPAPAAGRALRTFHYAPRPDAEPSQSLQAHYITYAPHHIVFMEDRPGEQPDVIVRAVHADHIHHLTERTCTP